MTTSIESLWAESPSPFLCTKCPNLCSCLPLRVSGSRVTRSKYIAYNTWILRLGTKSFGTKRQIKDKITTELSQGSPRVTDSGCQHFIDQRVGNTYMAPFKSKRGEAGIHSMVVWTRHRLYPLHTDLVPDRKSTRLNSSHRSLSRMPSSA